MMVSTFLLSASILYNLTSAALLIFLTAAAWTRIIRIYLGVFTLLRCLCRTLVLIGSGYFCDLLTLYLLFDLEMVQQTEGEMAEKFAARNLSVVLNLPEEAAVIHVDGRRMWRVLENIFGNAAKYAMPGTRVYADLSVSESEVKFSLKNVSEQQLIRFPRIKPM